MVKASPTEPKEPRGQPPETPPSTTVTPPPGDPTLRDDAPPVDGPTEPKPVSTPDERKRWWEEGAKAKAEGKPLESNPHAPPKDRPVTEDDAIRCWGRGWIEALAPVVKDEKTEPKPTPTDPRIKVWEDEGSQAYHNGLSVDANPHQSRVGPEDVIGPNHALRCWSRGYVNARKKAEPGWTGTEPSEAQSVDPQIEKVLRDPKGVSIATINTLYNRTLRQHREAAENEQRLRRTLTRLELVSSQKQHEADLQQPAVLGDGTPIVVTD